MILGQRTGASGSSPTDITGIRNEAEHQITFQMDYDNAVVVLKQYQKSDEVTITTACNLIERMLNFAVRDPVSIKYVL